MTDTKTEPKVSQAELMAVPQTHRPALEVWKERHGIWTWHSPGMGEAGDWLACAARDFIADFDVKKEDAENIGALFAAWCRIIDDAGYEGTGDTEELACHALAIRRNLPFLESISEADRRLPESVALTGKAGGS
jgi:hypothetical protein